MDEIVQVEEALQTLKEKLSLLIRHLQWKDFEVLIDLIFRQAGWQRVGSTGKTQKTLDLDLFAPVTGESAIVQIKSQSDLAEFKRYLDEFANIETHDKFFYVVHSPAPDLLSYENMSQTKLYLLDKITDLTISAGLIDWVIKKAS